MRFIVSPAPSDEEIAEIRSCLRQYNQQFVQCGDVESLAVFAMSDEGSRTGALTALTWGNWLQIQLLWVKDENRGQGIGSQLLSQAEASAKERGCLFSLIDTFSFQALPFYLQRGYEIRMTLNNFPEDQQRFYLTREL